MKPASWSRCRLLNDGLSSIAAVGEHRKSSGIGHGCNRLGLFMTTEPLAELLAMAPLAGRRPELRGFGMAMRDRRA
jgi:hypothetical protein